MFAAIANDQKFTIGACPAGDIHIFSQFDMASGRQDRQPTVAPVRQGVRRVTVDPDVPVAVFAAWQDLTKILQFRVLRIGEVAAGSLGTATLSS